MSSYYAGYHGVACVLSVVEFEVFLKRYMEKHPEDGFTEDNVDELYFDEFEFKRSNGNGIFHVVEISTDKADGMCLWPFKTEYQEDGGFKELRGKDQYVVFADYSPDSLEFIKDPKYHSYADILNELKGKLEDICQMIFLGMSVLGDIVTRCMRKNRDTGINVKRRYIKCRSLLRILMEK